VEGAAYEDGRTASIWDTFAHDGSVSSPISSYHLFNYNYHILDTSLILDTYILELSK
jgi:hypothetical protein